LIPEEEYVESGHNVLPHRLAIPTLELFVVGFTVAFVIRNQPTYPVAVAG